MAETPSYCNECGHRYLVHNWRHPVLVAGRCCVPGCECALFRATKRRPQHATEDGMEDAVYGRKELRPNARA